MKKSPSPLTTALLLAGVLLAAAAGAAPLRLNYSGAAIATEIDLDDDGISGIFAQGSGDGNLGPMTVHALFDAQQGDNTRCGDGEIQNNLVAASNVIQHEDGSQILLVLRDGRLCADPTFTSFTLTIRERIVGGTGRFAGATGRAKTVCQGAFLALDIVGAGGRPAHSAFSCKVKGRVN